MQVVHQVEVLCVIDCFIMFLLIYVFFVRFSNTMIFTRNAQRLPFPDCEFGSELREILA